MQRWTLPVPDLQMLAMFDRKSSGLNFYLSYFAVYRCPSIGVYAKHYSACWAVTSDQTCKKWIFSFDSISFRASWIAWWCMESDGGKYPEKNYFSECVAAKFVGRGAVHVTEQSERSKIRPRILHTSISQCCPDVHISTCLSYSCSHHFIIIIIIILNNVLI